MKTLVIASLLAAGCAGLAASPASAESFTFTGTSTLEHMIVAPVTGGKPVVSSFVKVDTHVTYASGRAADNTAQCSQWTTPPGSTFETNGNCVFKEAGNEASIIYGCDANKDQTQSNCWGYMSGMAGGWTGKTGTISWHGSVTGDGKSGKSEGTGQWNN